MGLLDTIKNIMTIPDEDDFEDDIMEEELPSDEKLEKSAVAKKEIAPRLIKSKAPNSAQQGSMQVVLVKPERFDDVKAIADHLNLGKTVVLNLEVANREESRRIVDFLSGVAYANGGNIRKVAANTFIIVGSNIDVMGELMLDEFDEGKIYF
ncbi:MAG: cell division protein SepF [Clostridia bacterium]|nr:cell division protein SepF [Clostridia bacterium]